MKKITVRLPDQKHNVWIGDRVLKNPEVFSSFHKEEAGKAFVIFDSFLPKQTKELLLQLKKTSWQVHALPVEVTESFKDFRNIYPLYEWLLKKGADRRSVIFAVGGGVIGDAVGFLAGTFLRGIRWVGVPTTLLAQVDSALGGKTGINHECGKNLIGVFHQPMQVVCDSSFLTTLPARDLVSGLGEMIKYGLIFDPPFYFDLKKRSNDILKADSRILEKTVYRCMKWKARTIAQDVQDTSGIREVLNFGHTLGHAIEVEGGYGYFRHGEAVILGMRAALHLSVLCGHLKPSVRNGVESYLKSLPLPPMPKNIQAGKLLARMKWDKKNRNGKVRFVLLKDLGKPVLDQNVPHSAVMECIQWLI